MIIPPPLGFFRFFFPHDRISAPDVYSRSFIPREHFETRLVVSYYASEKTENFSKKVLLMTLFGTQQFCSFHGGSISIDISCKEYNITQIAQVTLHLIKLWAGLISM